MEQGLYRHVLDGILSYLRSHPLLRRILDVGCGEGYYSAALAQALHAELWGVDISKDAVRYAAVRYRSGHWIAASAAHLPFPGNCFDAVLSLFALTMAEEFARVLRPGGEREALAVSLTPDYGLAVRYDDGTEEVLRSGEVSVRGLYGYTDKE